MGTYSLSYEELIVNQKIKETIKLDELHLYGSSRLGMYIDQQILSTNEYVWRGIAGLNNLIKEFYPGDAGPLRPDQ